MKIYIAGPYTSGLMAIMVRDSEEFRYKLAKKWIPKNLNILESFHYIGKTNKYPELIREDGRKIFLDSGAFSMFTQGIEVDLRTYADFIKENEDIIEVSSNLDHIGKDGEKKSWKNQRILEDYGARVQPVHHARDKDRWLEKYIKKGYKYIFLGGMVPESTGYLEKWLDRIWDRYLTDDKGYPIVKVHGFGLTTPKLMLKYPWYSVDSTSWLMAAASGGIYFPHNGSLKTIPYSDASPSFKKRRGHYARLTKSEQKEIRKWFKKYKFKEKNLQGRQYGRSTWNIMMYHWLQNNTEWPKTFINPHRGLF